jgi:hypothetical protein
LIGWNGDRGTDRATEPAVLVVRALIPTLLTLVPTLMVAGCADAPVTADQIQEDGTLRASQGLAQSSFSAQTAVPAVQTATQISAILAAQSGGAIDDAARFSADVGTVHLHLRAEGLVDAREVWFRWSHADTTVLLPGRLEPAPEMRLASSFDIDPQHVGPWRVEVLGALSLQSEPTVLFERTFEVVAAPR